MINLSLQAWHPTTPGPELAQKLGLDAEYVWSAGDPKVSSSGKQLGGIRETSYACMPMGRVANDTLAEALMEWCDRFEPDAAYLRSIVEEGGALLIRAYFVLDDDWDFLFDSACLSRIQRLGIEVNLSIYKEE